MLGTFSNAPFFVDGQELSAHALTELSKDMAKIETLVYGPQPLPLDSWILSPKALPLSVTQVSQDIFVGSFLYRPGVVRLELGFYLSFEPAYTPDTTTDSYVTSFNANFNSKCGELAVCVLLGGNASTTQYYSGAEPRYRAIKQFNNGYSSLPSGFTIDLSGNPYSQSYNVYKATSTVGAVVTGDGVVTLDGSKRLHKIVVDLSQTEFESGEIIPIKIALLGSGTNSKKKISSNFTTRGDLAYPGLALLKRSVYSKTKLDFKELYYLKYNTAYANTIADLSYTTAWPASDISASGLLTTPDLNTIVTKHNYLVERMQTRARPLTGSFMVFPVYSNSAALYYPQFPSDNTVAGEGPTAFNVQPFNAETTFATYAWSPQLRIYDQLSTSFKMITNTKTHSFFTVDLHDVYMGSSAYRTTDVFQDFTSGYSVSGGSATATQYPHFITALRYSSRLSRSLTSAYRTYLTKPFQVRIPSLTTPVFERRAGEYSDGYYFTGGGYYEDKVSIDFVKTYDNTTSFAFWGLAKGVDNYTSQIGLFSEIPGGLLPGGLALSRTDGLKNAIFFEEAYQKVDGYNAKYTNLPDTSYAQHWAWVSVSGASLSYRPVIVHYHDYSDRFIGDKNSYIGISLFNGVSVTRSNADSYSEYSEFEPHIFYTVSGIHETFRNLNTRLNVVYQDTYKPLAYSGQVVNPYFHTEPIFWGTPQSPLYRYDEVIREQAIKSFYFVGRRLGNLLVVRGRNVTIYTGDLKKINRSSKPEGSFIPVSSTEWEFNYSQSILSGDYEATAVVDLTQVAGLPYGGYYYIQGDSIVYAAEFFEDVL